MRDTTGRAQAWLALLAAAHLHGCATAPRPEPGAPAPASALAPPQTPSPAAAAPTPAGLPALLREIEGAYRGGRYAQGLALVKKVLEMKESALSTYDRLGTIYYTLGRHGEALAIWERGLPLEKDPKRRRALSESIAMARRSLGLSGAASPSEKAAPPKPAKPLGAAEKKRLEELYELGVAHYAQGEYLQATTLFLRILEADPEHAEAKKALSRLRLK